MKNIGWVSWLIFLLWAIPDVESASLTRYPAGDAYTALNQWNGQPTTTVRWPGINETDGEAVDSTIFSILNGDQYIWFNEDITLGDSTVDSIRLYVYVKTVLGYEVSYMTFGRAKNVEGAYVACGTPTEIAPEAGAYIEYSMKFTTLDSCTGLPWTATLLNDNNYGWGFVATYICNNIPGECLGVLDTLRIDKSKIVIYYSPPAGGAPKQRPNILDGGILK